MSFDSLRQQLFDLVLQAVRSSTDIDYKAHYAATVVTSDGNIATVLPDDARLRPRGGPLVNRPVRRPDGFTSVPVSGVRCMIGWDGGREDKSFVLLGYDGNGTVDTMVQSAITSVTLLTPRAVAEHDLASQHELGISSGTLLATPQPGITTAAAVGDDTSFDLTFLVGGSDYTGPIATILFGRLYGIAPRAVLSYKTGIGIGLNYVSTTAGITVVSVLPIPKDTTGIITVMVRG